MNKVTTKIIKKSVLTKRQTADPEVSMDMRQAKKSKVGTKSPDPRRKGPVHAQANIPPIDNHLSDIIEQQAMARIHGAATPVSYDSVRESSQMNERYTFTQTETR